MEIFISTSEGSHHPHKHPAEASAILFQVFIVFARLYVHQSTKEDEQELAKLIPIFVDYADRMKAVRGEAETKKLLCKMYEESTRVLLNGIKSVHQHPKFAAKKKFVAIDDVKAHTEVVKSVTEYGEKFIDHVLLGKPENAKSVIEALQRIAIRRA